MTAMPVEITGLQIASSDERSIIMQGRPLRIQLELHNSTTEPVETEARVDFSDIWGVSRLVRVAPVTVPEGRCWIEMRLQPDSLHLGRYSLSVEVLGHDHHRSRRLVDVLQVPDGLPPHLCDEWGVWTVQEGALPRDIKVWRVSQVRMRCDGGEPALIPPGALVEVVMHLDLCDLPSDLLVRLQIFSQRGALMVGTNNVRWGIDMEARKWVLRAQFDALNLAPGHYLATVGVWEDEWSDEAFQARHGYYEFDVGWPSAPAMESVLEVEDGSVHDHDHDHGDVHEHEHDHDHEGDHDHDHDHDHEDVEEEEDVEVKKGEEEGEEEDEDEDDLYLDMDGEPYVPPRIGG